MGTSDRAKSEEMDAIKLARQYEKERDDLAIEVERLQEENDKLRTGGKSGAWLKNYRHSMVKTLDGLRNDIRDRAAERDAARAEVDALCRMLGETTESRQ